MSDRDFGSIADQIGTRGASSSSDSSGSGETADFDPRPPSRVDRSPDDDRDQADPRSRSSSSRSRTGTETVRGDVSIGSAPTVERAAQLDQSDFDFTDTRSGAFATVERAAELDQSPVDRTTPRSGATRTVERAAQIDQSDFDFTGRTEPVDTPSGFVSGVDERVERSDEPGAVARGIDRVTDAFASSRPVASAGLSTLGTSFRTDSGLPIPGTERTLPGGRDFDRFRSGLEPTRQRIDTGIERGVDRVTPEPGSAPFDLGDIPFTDPATTAVGATLGTETGQRGAQRGVTTGMQAFNPAAITQDAATFTEFGVRGTDRVVDADEEELQEAFDVGVAAGETARDVGPAATSAAIASDPSRLFSAPAAAATIGTVALASPSAALGAGPSAALGAGRAARAGAGDVTGAGARAARRASRDLDDLEVELTRDPDSGPIDINLGTSTDDLLPSVSPRETARAAGQRAELGARRAVRDIDETITDARFTAGQAVETARDAPRVTRQRAEIAGQRAARNIEDTLGDVRFTVDETAARARDIPRVGIQRAELAGRRAARDIDEAVTDLRFAVGERRQQPSDLADEIGETLREFGTTGFLGDTGTGRARPFLAAGDRAAAARRRAPDFGDLTPSMSLPDSPSIGGAFLADTRTGRARPFLGATDREDILPSMSLPDSPNIGGAFLADTRTGRARPFLGGPDREDILPSMSLPDAPSFGGGFLGDTGTGRARPLLAASELFPDRPSAPSTPSVPRSFDDVGIGGEGGLSDLTLRIGSGRAGRRTIDVEDLEGPEPASGAPLFRNEPFEPDADAAGGAGSFGQIDTTVDLGGGQVARMRQQQRQVRRPMDRRTGRRPQRDAADPFALFTPFGDATGGLSTEDEITGIDAGPTLGTEPTDLGTATDPELGTGTGTGTATTGLLGAETVVGPTAGTGPVAGAEPVSIADIEGTTIAEPTLSGPMQRQPTARPRGRRRLPPFGFGPDGGADEFDGAEFGADDDTFDTGILSGSEAVEQIGADFDESDFRL